LSPLLLLLLLLRRRLCSGGTSLRVPRLLPLLLRCSSAGM